NRKREFLGGGVVLGGDVAERVVSVLWTREVPSGEDARAGVDVRFGERVDAHGEEVHQLTREVLLRFALHVGPAVEPYEHRRVLRHSDEEIPEVAERELTKKLDLALHLIRIFARLCSHVPRAFVGAERTGDLAVRGREVVVPEQRHLLLERTTGVDHSKEPALA